jgi:pimeloyl-CoA synthetase
VTQVTQDYLARKSRLEQENRELEREQKLRQDLLQIRLKKVQNAVDHHKNLEEQTRERVNARQRAIVDHVLQKRGLTELTTIGPNLLEDFTNLSGIVGMHDKAFEEQWIDATDD